MNRVFIYWDNSNIFHEAERIVAERNEGPGACFRVRIHFDNIFRLAHAGRPVQRAVAAGSIPPEISSGVLKPLGKQAVTIDDYS